MLIFISIASHLVPSLLHLHHHLATCLNDTFSLSPSQLPKSLSAEAFRRRKWKRRKIKILYQYLQSSCLFISDEKVGDLLALYLVDCWCQWADLRLKSLFVCSQTFFFSFVSERCLRSKRTFRDSKDRLSEGEKKETCLAGTFSTNISVSILFLRDLLLCFGNWQFRNENANSGRAWSWKLLEQFLKLCLTATLPTQSPADHRRKRRNSDDKRERKTLAGTRKLRPISRCHLNMWIINTSTHALY